MHLQRYKPIVPISQTKKNRLDEKMSHTFSDEYNLQQILKGYGIKSQREVDAPTECTQILSEINYPPSTSNINMPKSPKQAFEIVSEYSALQKEGDVSRITSDRIKNVKANFMNKVSNISKEKKNKIDAEMERNDVI